MAIKYYVVDGNKEAVAITGQWKPAPKEISVDELTTQEYMFIAEHTKFLKVVRKIRELVKEDVVSIIVSRRDTTTDFILEVYDQRFNYAHSDTRRTYLGSDNEFSVKCYTNMEIVNKIFNLLERIL